MRNIHFISGLPRSGSTLLAALLAQNPRFSAGMSGPMATLVKALLESMAVDGEYSMFISDDQRDRILRGLFEQYYGAAYHAGVVFDTNRTWCGRMPLLQRLFPGSKVIACVRETGWIVDSIERMVRANPCSPSAIFNCKIDGTVYSRAQGVASADGMLGGAYDMLKEAFYGEHAQHLLVVQYETLVTSPQTVMDAVYTLIGEPAFDHDFERVEFDASEFDRKIGTPGMHAVRSRVHAESRPTILPPDLFGRFVQDAFWRNPDLNPHGVSVI